MSLESSDPLMAARTLPNQYQSQVVLIDMLPDDVLLEIFDFYMDEDEDRPTKKGTEAWQSLVHVCRRWRGVVFGSPRRLDLELVCTPKTTVKETLDIWPPFPLLILGRVSETSGIDNIIAILEHRDRTRKIHLDFFKSAMGRYLRNDAGAVSGVNPSAAQALKAYDASFLTYTVPVLPNSFLGGSVPHLQKLDLCHIPFPGLLLSTTHLVTLRLHGREITDSGFTSPEVLANCVSALTSLETLWLKFAFPPWRSYPEGGADFHLRRQAMSFLLSLVSTLTVPITNTWESS